MVLTIYRASEYTSVNDISIWAGTLNLNGRLDGVTEDLSSWLWPSSPIATQNPDIFAVGFQEIVMLDARQMLSTDSTRRQAWERAVKKTLNNRRKGDAVNEYVLLRGSQLVGASLSIFVKRGLLNRIKNVEGGLKKVCLRSPRSILNNTLIPSRLDCPAWLAIKVPWRSVWMLTAQAFVSLLLIWLPVLLTTRSVTETIKPSRKV